MSEIIPIDPGEGQIIWNSLQECDPRWRSQDETHVELPDGYRVDIGWYDWQCDDGSWEGFYRAILVHDSDWESPISSFKTTDPYEAAKVASDYCVRFREIIARRS